MSRSLKKGPYLDQKILKKIKNLRKEDNKMIKVWQRSCEISPEMVGFTFGVYNGKEHIEVHVTEDMVGHKLGEFSPTKKFVRHGGKIQKELEKKK
jgi:small subunit ribosomal protein S19